MNLKEHNIDEKFGTFDGKNFVGEDGKAFRVNENYVSKSRLLPGDGLKMIITENNILFKQTRPIERSQKIGIVVSLPDGEHGADQYVMVDGRRYALPEISKRFYQTRVGDEVVVFIPADGSGHMCAIDCVVEKV